MAILPVILCGGAGTRLWPLSRERHPKQFLRLQGERSLLQTAAARLAGLGPAPPLLVGGEEYRFLMARQLAEIGMSPSALILEPCGRGTAPALTLAALAAGAAGEDPVLAAMPADHAIRDEPAFRRAVAAGLPLAGEGKVVTFGVPPAAPETGYGYIRRGERAQAGAFPVEAFVEKPGRAAAQAFLESGRCFWNAGIFLVRASRWLALVGRFRPDIREACGRAFAEREAERHFLRPGAAAFAACPADSIDCAVIEPLAREAGAGEAVVVPLDAGWSDVGTWGALWETGEKDGDGNVVLGDAVALDTRDTLVLSRGRLVACVGLEDAVVVETPDAVLVAARSRGQQVREVVGRLAGRRESRCHRKVFRPWGWYDTVAAGPGFLVKQLLIHPGAGLSLQSHRHRAEHWIVVAGTARVTRGSETFPLDENQSAFIPRGVVHRLENPGPLPLEMIEVQSGSYLGEDDILRLEDGYGP